MNTVSVELTNIDWRLLRVQKIILLRLGEYENGAALKIYEMNTCAGLVNLLDEIQDQACEQVPDTDVFTHRELRADAEELGLPDIDDTNDAPWVLVHPDTHDWLDAFMTREKADIQVQNLLDGDIESVVVTGEEWREMHKNGAH
jgi:hypothetical protein